MVHVCLKMVDLSPNYGHFYRYNDDEPLIWGYVWTTQAGVGQGDRKKHARFG